MKSTLTLTEAEVEEAVKQFVAAKGYRVHTVDLRNHEGDRPWEGGWIDAQVVVTLPEKAPR